MKRAIIFAGLSVLLGGCATSNAFKAAQKANTSSAWSQFLAQHPDASKSMKDEATRRRDEAFWSETAAADSPSAYLSFLKKNRRDKHAGNAKERLRSILADGKAEEDEYAAYFELDNDAPDEVRQGLEKVRFNGLKAARDPHAYALFMSQYPNSMYAQRLGPAVRRAQLKIAQALGTRLAYQFFLKRYPEASGDASKARSKLGTLPAGAPPSGAFNLDKLLPRLRRSEPILIRHECRKSLEAALTREPNPYSARSEALRDEIRQVAASGSNPPSLCARQAVAPDGAGRTDAAEAVRALAVLMQRQQELGSLFSAPDKLSRDAQEIGQRAATMSDESESHELELEAFYGSMPADPKNPDDTASKNAKEAGRRAKHAWEISRTINLADKRSAAAEVLRLMDAQKDLLLEVIAYYEQPVVRAGAQEDPTE